MEKGLLAIIVPSYNSGDYLESFLDSLLKQTYQKWQAFIIDDGSADNSMQILCKYSRVDSRILYLQRSRLPKGAQTCRNIGLEMAYKCAEYICFFDSDDILAPYCLEQRVQYMIQHPNLDFAIFPAKEFGGKNIYDRNYHLWGIQMFHEDIISSFLWGPLPFVVWNNIYRMESLKQKKINWDERLLSKQDSDFNIQTLLKGLSYNFAKPSKVDYFYRVCKNSNSIARNIHREEHFSSHIYLLNKIKKRVIQLKKHYYGKHYCSYVLQFTSMFIESDKMTYFNKASLMCKDISFWFYIRLMLLKYLYIISNKRINKGWIECVLFPINHFRNKKREQYRLSIGRELYDKIKRNESIDI